jgi:hypothetical protein
MTRRVDVPPGTTFGRWTVEGEAEQRRKPCGGFARFMDVRCSCGNTRTVDLAHLRHGNSTSCGCYRRERTRELLTKHGHNPFGGPPSPEYRSWCDMIQRCTNTKRQKYARYGGRGITVCAPWRTSFETFLADMGPRPAGHTLDRRDNDGHYEPGNCRWATASEQARNQQSTKLKAADVQFIRSSSARCVDLAKQFGILPGYVSRLRRGKAWV